ncbi:MAG: hypothetical protein Q9162_000609 [Coniocarpon cinnabarinum]
MQLLRSLGLVGALALTASAGGEHVFQKAEAVKQRFNEKRAAEQQQAHQKRAQTLPHKRQDSGNSSYLNPNSQKFVVDGTAIPEVGFDIGESYAGLLPISSDPNESRQLYFWFFPSSNPAAENEIAVWLNGGPGCSSLSGLLTENGPFTWEAGTLAPVMNQYSWSNLTNMVWIEQPVGTGFSQGTPNITDEIELGEQFKGFWRNFVDTFQLQDRDVYITGESYGGFYVPYIGNSFLEENNTQYYNLKGIAINDPIIGDGTIQQEYTVVPYLEYWANLMDLNQSFTQEVQQAFDQCGYSDFGNQYFTFPAQQSPFPAAPNSSIDGCDVFDAVYSAALEVNPCFNIYHITDTCPHLYGQLGIVNQGDYEPPGGQVYFNRTDVQAAINAPVGWNWEQCSSDPVFAGPTRQDQSPGPALDGTLTNVIDTTQNVIIGSGNLDFLLATNGTLFALQNTTWGGTQGFNSYPAEDLYVPYHPDPNGGSLAGAGILGSYGKERGLLFYQVQLAGHELPGYAAGAGYRSLEILLGRVPDFGSTVDFTTQSGDFTGNGTLP